MSVITDARARRLLGVLVLAAACTADNPLYVGGDDGGPGGGDGAGASDGGRHDLAMSCPPACGGGDLAAHQDLAGPPPRDLAEPPSDLARVCTASCGTCFSGGACCPGAQGGCCNRGEWCDNGTCRCGDGPSCTGLDHCSAGVISSLGQCGGMCCGGIGDPCPL
jgi:hypothetical protein